MLKTQEKKCKNLEMKSTSTDNNISQKVAKILFETGCVIFRPSQPIKLVTGILSPIYVDNRRLMSFPKERRKVAIFLTERIQGIGLPQVIAGAATGGIPHAAWVAERLNLPMVYVRSKPKEHGQGNQVEGVLRRGQRVVVVEDMVSTASSSSVVIKGLRDLGALVQHEVAIYTHTLSEADKNFSKLKIFFHPLTNLREVVKVAKREGFLKDEDEKVILNWAKDPKNWAKKMGFV